MSESQHVGQPRAERFHLQLGLSYKLHCTRTWSEAVSINISRSGLLFTAGHAALVPGDQVDFLIRLPSPQGKARSHARCRGRVVRVVPPDSLAGPAAIAVTIDRYVLERETTITGTSAPSAGEATPRNQGPRPGANGNGWH